MHSFIIVAVADNGVIGGDGDLVWDLPADQDYFLKRIQSALLLTGRVSYESGQGQEIFQDPERLILLTRQQDYNVKGAHITSDIEDAWAYAKASGYAELAVLGGAQIYDICMPKVDTLYITEVHENFEGDTFFPEINAAHWQEVARQDFPADKKNPYAYSFVTYRRKT